MPALVLLGPGGGTAEQRCKLTWLLSEGAWGGVGPACDSKRQLRTASLLVTEPWATRGVMPRLKIVAATQTEHPTAAGPAAPVVVSDGGRRRG